jgi:hypothetical protein
VLNSILYLYEQIVKTNYNVYGIFDNILKGQMLGMLKSKYMTKHYFPGKYGADRGGI